MTFESRCNLYEGLFRRIKKGLFTILDDFSFPGAFKKFQNIKSKTLSNYRFLERATGSLSFIEVIDSAAPFSIFHRLLLKISIIRCVLLKISTLPIPKRYSSAWDICSWISILDIKTLHQVGNLGWGLAKFQRGKYQAKKSICLCRYGLSVMNAAKTAGKKEKREKNCKICFLFLLSHGRLKWA